MSKWLSQDLVEVIATMPCPALPWSLPWTPFSDLTNTLLMCHSDRIGPWMTYGSNLLGQWYCWHKSMWTNESISSLGYHWHRSMYTQWPGKGLPSRAREWMLPYPEEASWGQNSHAGWSRHHLARLHHCKGLGCPLPSLLDSSPLMSLNNLRARFLLASSSSLGLKDLGLPNPLSCPAWVFLRVLLYHKQT